METREKELSFDAFLQQACETKFWKRHSVFCFRGKSYQPVFFSRLFDRLSREDVLTMRSTSLPLASTDQVTLQKALSQSFLGQQVMYWLGEYPSRVDKKMKEMLAYVFSYQGPHVLLLFIPEELRGIPSNNHCQRIQLADRLNRTQVTTLMQFWGMKASSQKAKALADIFAHTSQLPLDTVCLVTDYLDLIGQQKAARYQQFFLRVSKQSASLMALSKHFFARQPVAFFRLWQEECKNYSPLFWLSFWSEQLWQAYFVVQFLRQGNMVHAKRISYRLPFSFLSHGWKKVVPHELMLAHDFIYTIDYAIKRGSTFCALDLFYAHFFLHNFAAAYPSIQFASRITQGERGRIVKVAI